MSPFYTPENTRKPKVFWCFQGYKMGKLSGNGLISTDIFVFSDESTSRKLQCNFDTILKDFLVEMNKIISSESKI